MRSSNYNIILQSFDEFFEKKIQIHLLNNLHDCGLLSNINLRNKETKRIIEYTILKHVCMELENYNLDKNVIIVQPNVLSNELELFGYIDRNKMIKFVNKVLNKIKKSFPDKIFFSTSKVDISDIDTLKLFFNKSNKKKLT